MDAETERDRLRAVVRKLVEATYVTELDGDRLYYASGEYSNTLRFDPEELAAYERALVAEVQQ